MLLFADACGDQADIGLGCAHGDAGLEARENVVIFIAVIVCVVGVFLQWKKNFGLLDFADAGHHFILEYELWAKHAYDAVGIAIENEVAAEDLRIGAKFALPEAVGQDGDFRFAGRIVGGHESAAQERLGAEQIEERGSRADGVHALGLCLPGEIHASADGQGHFVKDIILRADLVELARRGPILRDAYAWGAQPEDGEAILLQIRQRAKEQRAAYAEDGGGGADAEAEREDDD